MTMQPSKDHFPDHPFAPHTGLKQLCDRCNAIAYKRRDLGWWIVAPVYGRLDFLPSSNRTERSDEWMRRLGVILGYPTADIEYFLNAQGVWTEPYDLVADGHFTPDEIADAGFIVYRHDDSIDGYKQAIQNGKQARHRLEELADDWNIPELNTFVSEYRNYLREEATPEKATS
ncbi:hypothetical protein ACFQL7_20590 [Halocatena marina]|uniref:HNH endonuclease n=2 Tax=Halocatena marina TaxID=2934937 RepID=A0ABD5YRI0_9EURY